MKYLIALSVLVGLGYILSVVVQVNETKKYIHPGIWFMRIVRALDGVVKAWFGGCLVPKPSKAFNSDATFAIVTQSMFDEIMEIARNRMITDGIIFPEFYQKAVFGCENFAGTMKTYFDQAYAKEYGIEGYGIPTRIFGYDQDSGGGHAVFTCVVDGKERMYSPYPRPLHFREVFLSQKECASYVPISKG